MDFIEFKAVVAERMLTNPFWFEGERDSHATDSLIEAVEAELAIELPLDYKLFLKEYGGGEFAFIELFSVAPGSEWNLLEYNRKWNCLEKNIVGISDDHAGGTYGFIVNNVVCQRPIVYWDHEDESGMLIDKKYDDVFTYIVEMGLKS